MLNHKILHRPGLTALVLATSLAAYPAAAQPHAAQPVAAQPVAGQMSMGSAAAAPVGVVESPAAALDKMLSLFQGELTGVVNEMPADKFDFAPSSATFATGSEAKFTGVRTFREQVIHLIQGNYYFYGSVSGLKPSVDMKAIAALTTKADLVDALAKSFVFAHESIATITAQNAFLTIKPVDGQNTRATLAAFAVAHGFDHYGQLVEYLRMNGHVPPGSK